MRTSVTLDDDVLVLVDAFRHETGLGASAAVNELVRRGARRRRFVQATSSSGVWSDVTDVAEVLDRVEGLEGA